MHVRTLSSILTLPVKFLLPTMWIAQFGLRTLMSWLDDGLASPLHGIPGQIWLMLLAWLVISGVLLSTIGRLKRVRLDQDLLRVSNYFREISIPLTDVTAVTESAWIHHHPVTIHVRHATEFGTKLTFMPTPQLFMIPRSHPVVDDLLREVRRVRRQPADTAR